jgi:uncharacterized protein (TIGR03067 family)
VAFGTTSSAGNGGLRLAANRPFRGLPAQTAARYDDATPSKEFAMRRVLPLLSVVCLAFAPAPFPKQRRADDSQGDLQALQGAWTERFADSAVVTIIGDRMVHTSDYEWKFTLKGKTYPKRIEAVGVGPRIAGKTRLGIYRLEKGKLIICWSRGSVGKLDWPASLDPIQKDVWIEVFTSVKR